MPNACHHDEDEVARLVAVKNGSDHRTQNKGPLIKSHQSDGDNDFRPTQISRSMDSFLEDAYREHSSYYSSLQQQWKYWCIMLSLGIANSSDASEILCLSYILSDATFLDRILLNSDWRGGMLAAAVFAGMLLGGLVIGTLGDWKGRKKCLLFGLVLNMTAGLLSACAPNVYILTVLRMVAGIGIGASVPPLFTLVAELAPPSQRGFCVTLCASFWMVGSIFVALVAIYFLKTTDNDDDDDEEAGTSSSWTPARWRQFAFACALPSALGSFLVHRLVPESPRFLALRGKSEEASVVVNLLGIALQYSGPPLESWEVEDQFREASQSTANYHPSRSFIVMEDELLDESSLTMTLRWIQAALADFWFSAGKLYTSNVRQTTWPLQMVWFSLSFGSYGLMTWINTLFFAVHLEDVYFNALLFALANLPGNLMTAYLMDRTGRAKLLVGSILSASASLLSFAFFASSSNENVPPNTYGVVLSACSFQCFTIAAWNTIDVMTSELFPTTVRSTGMGVCAASGRVGAMIAQFVNGALVGRPSRLLVVASVTLALGAMTPYLLPQHGDMTGLALAEDYGQSDQNRSHDNDGPYQEQGEELKDLSYRSHQDTAASSNQNPISKDIQMNAEGLARRG